MGFGGSVKRGEKCLPLLGGKRKFFLFSQFNLRNSTGALHNKLSDGLSFATRAFAQKRLFGGGYPCVDPP